MVIDITLYMFKEFCYWRESKIKIKITKQSISPSAPLHALSPDPPHHVSPITVIFLWHKVTFSQQHLPLQHRLFLVQGDNLQLHNFVVQGNIPPHNVHIPAVSPFYCTRQCLLMKRNISSSSVAIYGARQCLPTKQIPPKVQHLLQ